MPTQDKQPVPDAMQLEGAVAQDAGLPPGDAMPLQVRSITTWYWHIHGANTPNVLGNSAVLDNSAAR